MGATLKGIAVVVLLACTAFENPGQTIGRFEDVQNIDKRPVEERDSGLLSIDKELALGEAFAAEFEKSVHLVTDPSVVDLIDRIGQNLVVHSDLKIPCQFKVIDTDEMDVWAPLGGRVYVNMGLIKAAENEAELAGAMANGIAHISARHAARFLAATMSEEKAEQMPFPNLFAGHWSALHNFRMRPDLPDGQALDVIEREFEKEADQLAIQYLWDAGYDPDAYTALLRSLLKHANEMGAPGGQLTPFIQATEDRITASIKEGSRFPKREHTIVNTSEFDRVKVRLQEIQNAQKEEQEEINSFEQKRPILKP
jgi:predicted Zn-dependent protease